MMRLLEPLEQLEDKEEQLRKKIHALSDEQRKAYYKQLPQKLKDPDTYATLNCFFIGGFHHCYLRKYALFALELALLLIAILTLSLGYAFGWLIIIGLVIYELPQLFFAQKIARQYNYDVSCQLYDEIRKF